MALAAYARMCDMAGKKDEAAEYRRTAESFAKQWVKMADDGDHYRLAFDRPGTWSQKYNLVWDKLLGLNLFPPEVAAKEVAFYKTKLEPLRAAVGPAGGLHQDRLAGLDGHAGRARGRISTP